ncbi:conserved hypothetical protein [Nitrosotalea sinensis]|uniref:CHAD domain-containing protein n=1 Tax=Nitrosotalea sinensis TaxID=1499975 RepID=A0A2H1EJ92_9ARCH|nr:CHAD domain-containing protein [Candidatus Nitrosotalea sinensis]SHO48018.1 conserved hypothetical protein [Candidatus Nitrosotalea sinensis]
MKDSLKLNKKIFLKKFEKISNNFQQELNKYIENPSDENIHDIRVSIRRLESAYRILSKNTRKQKKNKHYLKQIRTLFKSNASIRDYDIICARMEAKYHTETTELVSSLRNLRGRQLKDAIQLALEISNSRIPKTSSFFLKKSELKKKYQKILDEMILNIQKNIIIVLGDEKKINELHMLRKDFKKLRYSLELAPKRKIIVDILKNLKNIQEVLGDIHDSDIIIDYLKNIKQDSRYSSIIDSEVLERSKKYSMFVTIMKRSNISLKL